MPEMLAGAEPLTLDLLQPDPLGVLTTTRPVVAESIYVSISRGAIEGLAPALARARSLPPAWPRDRHFFDGSEKTVNWLLLLDALNFSFWGDPPWRVTYQGETHDGYWALVLALRRAVEEGHPLWDAGYLAEMSLPTLAHILRGENEIPLLPRRWEIVREVGQVLRERYGGQFARAVEAAGRSAVRLVLQVVHDFPSFYDVADWQGREVRFFKRAQILVADLYGAFQGQAWGEFHDLDQLTAFADYKLPQVLRRFDILVYRPDLAQKVDHRFVFPPRSREEVEIRASTIWAVEWLRRELANHGRQLRAFEIDWWLWNEGQRSSGADRPYHLVRTTDY